MSSLSLTLKDLTFEAGGAVLIQSLSCVFPAGQTTVLLGNSGSGKSLLLKLSAGLTPPSAGSVSFGEHSLEEISETTLTDLRGRMGFLFQNAALWANKTVFQNLELPLSFHKPKMPLAERQELIKTRLDSFGLLKDLHSRPSELSVGEQKIVGFLRATILDPELLFLDEPFSGLDDQTSKRITERLKAAKARGATLLLVNQVASLTAQLADQLVLLKGGQILAQGPFEEIVKQSDPEIIEILTPVLSQASTFSNDILDLLGGQGGFP